MRELDLVSQAFVDPSPSRPDPHDPGGILKDGRDVIIIERIASWESCLMMKYSPVFLSQIPRPLQDVPIQSRSSPSSAMAVMDGETRSRR